MIERASWWCCRCRHRHQEPPPRGAWQDDGDWYFVCERCRKTTVHPLNPAEIRCFDCGEVEPIEDLASVNRLAEDPTAAIAFKDGQPWYVHCCQSCRMRRVEAARDRQISRRRPRRIAFEMARVHEMAQGFVAEGASLTAAVRKAVDHEMLVDDAARHPEFMRWLRRRELVEPTS